MLTFVLALGPTVLAAQTQQVTRTSFELSTPEGYTAATLVTGGSVWGIPARHTSDSDRGAVAYMLLGALKGCDFANAEVDRQSKVYVKTQSLGTLSDYASATVCRQTSSRWTTSWTGVRITHLLFFDEGSSSNTSEATYNETTEEYSIDTATPFSPLSFPEGTFSTRSVAENSFAGTNVGSPVSAIGSGSLAYTMSGTDADSFLIIADTGQIRTKAGVTYDYETKNRYSVTVSAEDGSGNTDSIAVAIEIADLSPYCMAPPDFRTDSRRQERLRPLDSAGRPICRRGLCACPGLPGRDAPGIGWNLGNDPDLAGPRGDGNDVQQLGEHDALPVPDPASAG